jgi:predicted transcriptional regulator
VQIPARIAAEFLRRWGITGAPVFDIHGTAVGVFSLKDLAGHLTNRLLDVPVIDPKMERARDTGELIPTGRGFHFEAFDEARVSDLMTPAVISVPFDAPLATVVRAMEGHAIHRVFVRDADGDIVGVITTMDVLRWVGRLFRARRRTGKPQRVA